MTLSFFTLPSAEASHASLPLAALLGILPLIAIEFLAGVCPRTQPDEFQPFVFRVSELTACPVIFTLVVEANNRNTRGIINSSRYDMSLEDTPPHPHKPERVARLACLFSLACLLFVEWLLPLSYSCDAMRGEAIGRWQG